jgi:hypothetical protein
MTVADGRGTAFVPAGLPDGLNPALVFNLLLPKGPNATVVDKVLEQYPANPSLGA